MNRRLEARLFLFSTGLILSLLACGPAPTPTSVVGRWELASVEGTAGGKIPATKVLQLGLDADGGVQLVACLDPVFEGTTRMTCHEQLVCATGHYTWVDSVLTITQTGRPEGPHGRVTFSPGVMSLSGEFFGPTYKAANFNEVDALTTACLPLP